MVEEDELSAHVNAGESETELVATETQGQIRKLLDGTIEEWMVSLHPSQRAIVRAQFHGPARVRGGPGTGKTVVALHRARRLAREATNSQRVLLTTFLRTLPKVWQGLMGTMDPRALECLDGLSRDFPGTHDLESRRPLPSGMSEISKHQASGITRQRLVTDRWPWFLADDGLATVDAEPSP